MKLLVITAMLALGAGGAHAQTYRELSDACRNVQQPPAERVKSCDAALSKAQPDATADRALILLNRSDAFYAQKKYDQSIADADASAKLMKRYQPSQNQRCWVRAVANKELDVARWACNEAVDINKDDPAVWDSAGLVGLRTGEWQAAWNDYNRAYTLDSRMTGSLYGRGLAGLALGRADADADLAKAASAAPEFAGYGLNPDTIRKRAAENPPKAAN